jgi:hypothetical protein
MVGSWLASPVVWVAVAGGRALGVEAWSGATFAGRVAVVLGGELLWAFAACTFERKTPDSRTTASVMSLMIIDLAPVRSMRTAGIG